MTRHLCIVRHGETAWSVSEQHTGRTDLALTEHGEAEARGAAGLLRGIVFSHVFSSPLQRAKRTAELAGFADPTIEPDLIEWDYGDYEGLRSRDIAAKRSDWNLFRDGAPGGELPEQVSDRADRLIAKLAALDGTVAVFTHGHFGCSLAARWIGLAILDAQHLSLSTASLSVLGMSAHHPDIRVIELWNQTAEHRTFGPS